MGRWTFASSGQGRLGRDGGEARVSRSLGRHPRRWPALEPRQRFRLGRVGVPQTLLDGRADHLGHRPHRTWLQQLRAGCGRRNPSLLDNQDARTPRGFLTPNYRRRGGWADLRDWPIGFEDLEPYYEEVEEALQIAGPTYYPWGRRRRRRFPQREHEINASANMLIRGCRRLGIPVFPAPVSTLSAPHKDRPPRVYRGFCNYGCTTNAKSSILVT